MTTTERRLRDGPPYSALILDMDGLMLNTEVVERTGWKRAAGEFGCSLTNGDFLRLVGRNALDTRHILTEIWTERGESAKQFEAIQNRKIELVNGMAIDLKEGVGELLDWAILFSVPVAVASSTQRETVFRRLTAAGLLNRGIDAIIGGDEIATGKPSPAIFQLAAQRLGVRPASCIVLEDSDSGIEAAAAAKMIPILVPDSAVRSADPPLEILAKAYKKCNSLFEVLELLAWRPTL